MTVPRAESPLQRFIDQASGSVGVLHDAACATMTSALGGDGVVIWQAGQDAPEPADRWSAVVLAVADAAALRRIVSVLPRLGRTRSLVCWLAEAEQAALLVPRPEWPSLASLHGRRLPSGAAMTSVRFARPVLANAVFEELARAVVPAALAGSEGVLVATTAGTPETAPPADPGVQVLASSELGSDPAIVVPPDVVLATQATGSLPQHEVIARPPALVSDPALLVGPLDEGVLNPTGFVQRPAHGLVDLETDRHGQIQVRDSEGVTGLDAHRGATARVVSQLRNRQGIRVTWDHRAVEDMVRAVAGLAMAGVPILSGAVPDTAAERLGPGVVDALAAPADLGDPLRREEHSVRLRRAALLQHSTLAWRGHLAAAAGLSHAALPSCSVVLATRRPDQLDFALRQVAKQRGVDAELVLAAHGFSPDESWVRDRLGDRAVVVSMPEAALFGDVLNAGVRVASGDLVVKMDDYDWYGPDVLTDLLLARRYSGAEVVGMTAEYVYLEALDRTIRRNDESERTSKFVAGGTMMVSRAFLASVGGFRPVRRYVDAQLLSAAHAAGASVYRTHGLGYVLRRSRSGHTWDAGVDYFLEADRLSEQWEGFVPSRLLEYDDAEAPRASGAAR
ncbi:MAG: glycosyltransferase family 2 protein [Nocardioides sp.]